MLRSTLQKCKAQLPNQDVPAALSATKDFLRGRLNVDDEGIREAIFMAAGRPDEEMRADIDKVLSKELKEKRLAGVSFRPDPNSLRRAARRKIQTAEGVILVNLAADALFRSLTNEVEADGVLMFRGPPVVRYTMSRPATDIMSPAGLDAMQAAARWVFESDREVETRHGLLTAELARTNVASPDAAVLFERGSAPALEGAKIALQLGLHKLSLDSLKAMADLRRAVTDETTKLSDATRQLATAVAGALFAGIGIIAARLTMAFNGPIVAVAILVLGVVLCAYVAAVIISGLQFVGIQRELRSQWRERLYRFLPETEYEAMVSRPAAKAEQSFKTAAIISGVLAGLLLVAVIAVSFAPIPLSPAKTDAQSVGAADRTSQGTSASPQAESSAAKGGPGSAVGAPVATPPVTQDSAKLLPAKPATGAAPKGSATTEAPLDAAPAKRSKTE